VDRLPQTGRRHADVGDDSRRRQFLHDDHHGGGERNSAQIPHGIGEIIAGRRLHPPGTGQSRGFAA